MTFIAPGESPPESWSTSYLQGLTQALEDTRRSGRLQRPEALPGGEAAQPAMLIPELVDLEASPHLLESPRSL